MAEGHWSAVAKTEGATGVPTMPSYLCPAAVCVRACFAEIAGMRRPIGETPATRPQRASARTRFRRLLSPESGRDAPPLLLAGRSPPIGDVGAGAVERLFQPVEDTGAGDPLRAALAVCVGSLDSGELQQRLGAGEVLV